VKITVENTSQIVYLKMGLVEFSARVWQGNPKLEFRCKSSSRGFRAKFRKLIRVDDLTHEFEIPRTEKARKGKMAQIKPKSRRKHRCYLGLD